MTIAEKNQVWSAVKAMSPQERVELRNWIDKSLAEKAKETEAISELDRLLLERGIISSIPTRRSSPEEFRNWKRVKVEGKPISETIIEERR